MTCLSVIMLYILVVCPVLLASVLTLTIDSQLGTSIEDCFERISIGEQLPSDAIYRNVSELTTKECEQICKQDIQCQAYDYGVGAKGNATCELSKVDEKELKEKSLLQKHPDYDVYVRRFQCEQTPPSPIEPQSDDPGDSPQHRPVFRPDADEKRPAGDFPPLDLRPYETHGPYPTYRPRPGRPFNNYIDNDRPDCANSSPDYDTPPSYGAHRPQDIPYRPDRPSHYGDHRPQDIPYRPERPPHYGPHRPHEDIPDRPPIMYGDHRPHDIHYRPERPDYNSHRPQDVPDRPPSYGVHKPQDIPYRPERPHYDSHRPQDVPDRPPSYGTHKPQDIPYRPGRPDYDSHRPQDVPDRPPSYGAHKPQDIPYRPGRPDYDSHRPQDVPDRPPSYGAHKPQDIPYRPGRPDYDSHRPQDVPDRPPSYGAHKPQDIPYRPEKPVRPNDVPDRPPQYGYHKPQDIPYRPGQPSNQTHKPDPYDVLQFDDPYGRPRPRPPASYRPDPYYPSRPSDDISNNYGPKPVKPEVKPERPQYVYIIRPNRKPYPDQRPQEDSGYVNKPTKPYENDSGHPDGPIGPPTRPYRPRPIYEPSRPNDKPSYSYNEQYANNYGANSHQDNSIYVEIYDPPRPYRPSRPDQPYEQGIFGYGTQSDSQYSQNSQSNSQYGSSSSYSQNSPVYDSKPQKYPSTGYGQSDEGSYGNQKPSKPSYGGQFDQGYGSQSGFASQSYGETNSHHSNQHSSHGSFSQGYGNQKGQSYGSHVNSQHGSLSGNEYGHHSSVSLHGHGQNDQAYGVQSSHQSQSQSSYGHSDSQSSQSYDQHQQDSFMPQSNPSYGGQESDTTGYGSSSQATKKPNRPGYGDQASSQNEYGSSQPDDEDTYKKPSGNKTGYDRPDYKPVYEFDNDRPEDVPSYIVRPGGEIVTTRPVSVGDYGERPGYGREPGGDISYKACFRRVLAGRRALRSHVRRVLRCEQLEDCRRECALEKRFHCESFNYRLDPSFRGKGLCELMTKPIEAFNLHQDFVDDKDYDFYELDRNSLEPYCPETLHGAGMLHSGYLSSKSSNPVPSYEGWDRSDLGHRGYKYQEDRRGHRYSSRRYEDQFYVPYQIGISRSNDDENWGQYGGVYGGSNTYYKDLSDYHKSSNHWRLADERVYHGVKPYGSNSDFKYHSLAKSRSWDDDDTSYGSWKRGWYGGSRNELDYETKPKRILIEAEDRSDDPPVKDCSSRRSPGMSLGSGVIRRSLYARNVVECEAACFGETDFKCVSYSYRYSSSHGKDNCFLSERPYKGLEMSADTGSDVYAMPQDHGCGTINKKPWIESECFWHVRSGAAVSGTAARAALTVTGLGACEAECIRAHDFFCRGFSFRFETPSIGDDLENCVLTSTPPTSLDTGRGLRPTTGHELYARGNYGRGCEPALYDDIQYRDTQCYLKYDNAAKLRGSAVRGQARVADDRACGAACTDAPFRCLSFSFRSNAPPDKDNCLLSEIRLFDLQRGVDYEHSADDWLFAFDLFNGQCWRKVHGKEHDIPSSEVPRPLSAVLTDEHYSAPSPHVPPVPETYITNPSGPEYPAHEILVPKPYAHDRPDIKPYLPIPETIPSGPSGPDKPGYLDKPYPPSGYDKPYPIEYDPPEYGHKLPAYDHKLPEYDHKPPYPELRPNYKPFAPSAPPSPKPAYGPIPPRPYPEPIPEQPRRPNRPILGDREDNEIIASWRHYTVSGFPCRKGTTCAQNQVAGHWACEPEGGEIGSWDYCCAPTHRCGYSEGFQKPWCYVGPEHDQWRPCSEKYYPYHQHKVPHPSQVHGDETPRAPSRPHRERPGYGDRDRDRFVPGPYLSEADRKYWDDLYRDGPKAYYDKYGNPLPEYTRVPTEERPYIKYRHNYPRPGSGTWVPVPPLPDDQPQRPGELGVPRYWPVAYLHKSPPPNMTYFRYNETSTTDEYLARDNDSLETDGLSEINSRNNNKANGNDVQSRTAANDGGDLPETNEQRKNNTEDIVHDCRNKPEVVITSTQKNEITESTTTTEVSKEIIPSLIETTTEIKLTENVQSDQEYVVIKGIDDKLEDFTTSIEIFDIEDAKPGKSSQLKTVEAEERQIEAIGRLLASQRSGKVPLEKRSQKDLESKKISLDKDFVDFNFGNKFSTAERKGVIQKVSKVDIERERLGNDKSLEVSETTFVRPPRVLSTTENIRKAIINGKIFYDATIRDQRDLVLNSTRKPKNLRLEESRGPSVIANSNANKKTIRARNTNPIRRVRRVYRKRYNPEEVRRRLLEREKNKTETIKS